MKWYQYLFSIFNENNHKKVTIFGIKFKIKLKNKIDNRFNKLQEEITDLSFCLNKKPFKPSERIKIYFLFHSKAFWPSWESFWVACNNDDRIETTMIYCPVKEQTAGYNGQFKNAEDFLKENNIPYRHIDDIDFKIDKPHILVMQTPYDDFHRFPIYHSANFKKMGIRVVYITYGLEFTESKLSIKNHFKLSITKNSWRIYTFSNELVKDYVKYSQIYGVAKCFGHPKFDALFKAKNIKMPKWLEEKVNGKKIICWHTHFPCKYSVMGGKNVISTFPWEENLKILEYIKKDKEYFYIFMAHHMFWGAFEHTFNIQKEELDKFKEDLNNGENSIVWEGEYPEVLNWSDIFMGERSAVTMEMITTGKPVIYLENSPEIYNKFGQDVIDSYYYAKTSQEALDLLDKIKSGYDEKQNFRKAILGEYFAPYWNGECGNKILQNIIQNIETEEH